VGAGMVICLERAADLHMAQLMPVSLINLVSLNPDWFYLSGTCLSGNPGQNPESHKTTSQDIKFH